MNGLKKTGIDLNRKMLSEMAINDPRLSRSWWKLQRLQNNLQTTPARRDCVRACVYICIHKVTDIVM